MHRVGVRAAFTRPLVQGLMAVCLTAAAGLAQAGGLDALSQFLQHTRSARADFVQVVTPPTKAGQTPRSKTSSGQFAFIRPTRFRFDYQKPFVQVIVADGQTLWLYDADLEQVTARQQAQALSNTPAALIATAADVASVQRDFDLQEQPAADGLQWVQATPRQKDGSLQSVRIGLRVDGAQVTLARLDILDQLGQRSQLSFERFETNPALGAGTFQFKPPRGVDVVRP